MSSGENLPQDIIKDIVSRLPVKSLHRFKCTSFSWKSQISDPQFAKTHLNRTKIKNSKYAVQKIIIISGCGNLYSVDPNHVNPTSTKLEFPTVEQHDTKKWVQVLSSCDGLLLVSRSDKSIFLLNPSTRECKKLPICPFVRRDYWNKCVLLDKYGVGYDSSTDDYKVLWMLSYFDEEGVIDDVVIVAVYSLKTNAWRRVEDFQHRSVLGNSGGIFLNGCLHYLYCDAIQNCSKRIIAFDLSDEVFREVPLPACLDDSTNLAHAYYRLEVLGDCLCLVRQHNCQVGVWMREEHGVRKSWTKLTIDMTGMSTVKLLCLFGENEYLLKIQGRVYGEKLVVYDPKKETMRDMVVRGIPTKFTFGVMTCNSAWHAFPVVHPGRLGYAVQDALQKVPSRISGSPLFCFSGRCVLGCPFPSLYIFVVLLYSNFDTYGIRLCKREEGQTDDSGSLNGVIGLPIESVCHQYT
ncbi:F-box/kelch-repeat protein At3g06240-like [Rhododendron vialii]|uniref:F-box/kelch-repeat protein At3g06240-like n=1 Tax=Rhododendron vialii TaxID=182163 RepID=UPI00265F75A7|nr:F-box/kelch-repeat protein At3g06240-like [Rhododendron vialii]